MEISEVEAYVDELTAMIWQEVYLSLHALRFQIFSEENASISNALYVLDAILLYYGDCFCSRTHGEQASFIEDVLAEPKETRTGYFGGDLMPNIPHLNENDLSIMKFLNPFAVNSSHMQHGS